MKPIIPLPVVFAACVALLDVPAAAGAGFGTPEDAVMAYVEAIASHDFDAVVAASAAEEMGAGFDFVAYVDRLHGIPPSGPTTSDYPMFAAMNKARFTDIIGRQVQFLAYGLMTDSDVVQGTMVQMDGAGAEAFSKEIDPQRLEGLTVRKVGAPMPSLLNGERYQANAARQAEVYGADELTERVALLSFEGATYLLGFTLLRYGDEWGVSNQTSPLAGTTVLGTAQPITPEEFDKWLE